MQDISTRFHTKLLIYLRLVEGHRKSLGKGEFSTQPMSMAFTKAPIEPVPFQNILTGLIFPHQILPRTFIDSQFYIEIPLATTSSRMLQNFSMVVSCLIKFSSHLSWFPQVPLYPLGFLFHQTEIFISWERSNYPLTI